MACCWAGDDGRFNSWETARAWCIYITVPIESFILWYIAWTFYRTRHNVEMFVRLPSAMIVVTLTMWMCTIFEAIANLAEDLDLAKLNWDKFLNRERDLVSLIFYFLSTVGYLFCSAIFLCRIWTFWYRSEWNKIAQIYGEAAVKENRGSLSPSIYVKIGNTLMARKKVWVLTFTWVSFVTVPLFMIDFILVIDQEILPLIAVVILSFGMIPMYVLMVVFSRSVKNNYGVVEEYKAALAAIICTFGVRFSLLFTGFADSYYRFLIDFECRVVIIVAYFMYVMYDTRRFDVNRKSLSATEMCAKLLNCCKGSSSLDSVGRRTFSDISLQQLLSDSLSYKLFLSHVEDTLCTENLFFFVDVYRHRKSLDYDPFLKLSEGETMVVYACARIKMDWIDTEMRKTSSIVLTCRDIYRLYIKPSSKMEVNIPGKMRKQLVNLFEPKKGTTRGLSFMGKLVSQMTTRAIPTYSLPIQPNFSTSSSQRSIGSNLKTQRSMYGGSYGDKWPSNDSPNFSMQRFSPNFSENQCSIDHLYPAWKTLVNLLNFDSLVRFKMGHKGKTNCTESESVVIDRLVF